jgi:hypothetical protein
VFTLFRGLRWEVGTDWYSYYNMFLDVNWDDIFSFDRGFGTLESGYVFINLIIKSIGGNYTLFLLITNLFILITYAKFALTNSKTPVYVFVLIMFSTQFFPVRIGIAVAFILYGLCHFSRKNYIKIAICTSLAISIHFSAIVFIPVYFLFFSPKIPTTLSVVVMVSVMTLVQTGFMNNFLFAISTGFGFLEGSIIVDKFVHYLDYTEKAAANFFINNINAIILIVTLIPLGIMRFDYKKENYAFLYNVYFVFVLLGVVFSTENTANLKRLQNYFMFAFPLLFSTFIVSGKKKHSQYRSGFTLIFVMYILYRSYTLFFGVYPELHFPYISIFHDNITR